MQDLESIGRELQRRGKTEDIRKLAESEDGQKLGRMLDGEALAQAARGGDSEQLRRMLSQVLSTREGQRLADRIQKLMRN